jgi:hypothetical protein
MPTPPRRAKPKPPPPRPAEPQGGVLTRATAAVADASAEWAPRRAAARPHPPPGPPPPQTTDVEPVTWPRAGIGSAFDGALEDAREASSSRTRATAGVQSELSPAPVRPRPPREPPPPQTDAEPESWGSQHAARERASSVLSTGSDFEELMQASTHKASAGLTRVSAAAVDASVGGLTRATAAVVDASVADGAWSPQHSAAGVQDDARLARRVPRPAGVHLSTEASSAVTALIDGEEVSLTDDEVEVQPEPELQLEPEPESYVSAGPHFDAARLQAAAHARANPVWERSPKHGGPNGCGWCDQTFCRTRLRYHCHRCGWAVCDRCSPHRLILDTWLPHTKPHEVRHDVSDNLLRVCDGCARAAHDPAAAPVFYLATISRVGDHINVRQVGPLKSDAIAEWDAASLFDMHALFELLPGGTAATFLNRSRLMRDETALALQRKVESTFAANSGRVNKEEKKGQVWYPLSSTTDESGRETIQRDRDSVKSMVTLDYRNYTITIAVIGSPAVSTAGGQLSRNKSVAVVRQTLTTNTTITIHCADCQTVEVDGSVLKLKGLTVDDGEATEGWSKLLQAESPEDAQEWKVAIVQVCQHAKALNARFHRLRLVQSHKRHHVQRQLYLQRQVVDDVWSQLDGRSTMSKNKLLRKLTKEHDKRIPDLAWAPEDTEKCEHPGCTTKFGIRLGIPHHMHHCRLCGQGVCSRHFVDAGARLPASQVDEGVPPEAHQPLDDQTTAVERVLGRNRLELLNTEVDVFSESASCWVVGRISGVDDAGNVTVSYSHSADVEPHMGPVRLMTKTINASAASSIRRHQVSSLSDMSVPVCVTCKDLLRTVDESLESGHHVAQVHQIMSSMSEDYRTVKTAGFDGPIASQELHKVWEARLPRLREYGLKAEAQEAQRF